MVLPHRLGLVHAAIHVGKPVLRNADKRLQDQQHVEDYSEDVVRGAKVRAVVVEFVVLDDDQPRNERQQADAVKERVQLRAARLLGGRGGRLQDEDGLGRQEQAGGVEELEGVRWGGEAGLGERDIGKERMEEGSSRTYWMCGEERQLVFEDGRPDNGC